MLDNQNSLVYNPNRLKNTGGEHMSEKEKQTAKKLVEDAKQMPEKAKDYLRGYMQGVIDSKDAKAEK